MSRKMTIAAIVTVIIGILVGYAWFCGSIMTYHYGENGSVTHDPPDAEILYRGWAAIATLCGSFLVWFKLRNKISTKSN